MAVACFSRIVPYHKAKSELRCRLNPLSLQILIQLRIGGMYWTNRPRNLNDLKDLLLTCWCQIIQSSGVCVLA